MKIRELENAPDWLKSAATKNADVSIVAEKIVWRGGEWRDGVWRDGEWHDGVWLDGVWHYGWSRGGRIGKNKLTITPMQR